MLLHLIPLITDSATFTALVILGQGLRSISQRPRRGSTGVLSRYATIHYQIDVDTSQFPTHTTISSLQLCLRVGIEIIQSSLLRPSHGQVMILQPQSTRRHITARGMVGAIRTTTLQHGLRTFPDMSLSSYKMFFQVWEESSFKPVDTSKGSSASFHFILFFMHDKIQPCLSLWSTY